MMKKISLMGLIVAGLIMWCGSPIPCDIYVDYVTAKPGDCLETIIAPYYDKCNNKMTWEEYRYNMRMLNENLFKDGRSLQIGDSIKVEWYEVKK